VILATSWSPIGLTANTINIDITTHLGDQQSYVEGDSIEFLINLSQDAYVLILYIDAAGNIIQILPNRLVTNNFVTAGLYINIPEQSAPFKFTVSAPFGRETVWAYASKLPFPELSGKLLDNELKQLNLKLPKIKSILDLYFKKKKGTFSSSSLIIETTATTQ